MRSWRVAPSAEKKTKCSTPARSAASTIRQVAIPLSSSIDPRGLVADRRRQVDDGAARRASRCGTTAGRQVAERDLDADALGPEAARDRVPGSEPARAPAVSRGSRADPTRPVAPVRRIIAARQRIGERQPGSAPERLAESII